MTLAPAPTDPAPTDRAPTSTPVETPVPVRTPNPLKGPNPTPTGGPRPGRRPLFVPGGDPTGRPHVVVLGAGFAGLAALHALREANVEVTVVDRHAFNTFQPLLYQVATGGLSASDVAYPARAMTARYPNARFRLGTVARVDPDARQVLFADGDPLTYDHLVIATGVSTNYYGVPGAAEHALPIYTVDDALAVRRRYFDGLERRAAREPGVPFTAVVVGAGATGVEMAGTLAELAGGAIRSAYPELAGAPGRVVLVEQGDAVLAPFASKLRRYAAGALRERGVELRLSTAVRAVHADSVVVSDTAGGGEDVIGADIVVWAAGVGVPPTVQRWGLPQVAGGRVATGPDLSVPGHPEIFVAGDVGGDLRTPLPQLAQPAIQSGRHAGQQIARVVAGARTEPFTYRDKGTMATIGRRDAVVELPNGTRFGGTAAWLAWVGLHVVTLLGRRNRAAVLLNLTWRYFRAHGGSKIMLGG